MGLDEPASRMPVPVLSFLDREADGRCRLLSKALVTVLTVDSFAASLAICSLLACYSVLYCVGFFVWCVCTPAALLYPAGRDVMFGGGDSVPQTICFGLLCSTRENKNQFM
jgi:hypothetical protein